MLKVAQIGIGHDHAPATFLSLAKQANIFTVAGFALPEGEKEAFSNKLSCFEGFKEMTVEEILNDPEIQAVTIETAEIHLSKYASLALMHGKSVHMDKPGGLSLADFEELIKTAKEKDAVLHLGYMYRYNPYVKELLARIKAGELGEIFSVEAQMNCRHTPEKRQWLETFPGGMMFFLGCHLIDLILQIQGKPERIIPLNKSTGIDSVRADDFGMAVFEYKNGISFAKTCAEEMGGFARRQLVVSGSKATVELKPLEMQRGDGQYTRKTEYKGQDWQDAGDSADSPPYDRYDGMLACFARMAKGEIKNPYTPDYELELYKTVLIACGVEI